MAKTFDAILKQILDEFTPDWGVWLAPQFGLPAGPLVAIDPDLSTVQAAPDKVFRLPEGAGLLHLEVQSSWDGDLADRMLLYNVLLQHRHGDPVYSAVILLRPEVNARNLTGVVSRVRPDGHVYHRFEYAVVRVWEQSADALLAGGLGTAPLGLLTDDAADRLPALVRPLIERVGREVVGLGRQESFLTGCFMLMGLRYDTNEMRPLFEGIDYMKESSFYQMILNEGRTEGIARGLAEGRTEGIARGLAEGRTEALRVSLIAVLERKFGGIPAEMEQRIKACADADQLQAGLIAAATAATLAEYASESPL